MRGIIVVLAVFSVAFCAMNMAEGKSLDEDGSVALFKDGPTVDTFSEGKHETPEGQPLLATVKSQDCCYKVEVNYFTGNADKAYNAHKSKYGYYYAQRGQVHGKMHYESSNGKHGIWYWHDGGAWIVGEVIDR